MASTVIGPTSDTIAEFLEACGFTAYKWSRQDYELPAGVVEIPTVSRRQENSQLGSLDWDMSFPVVLYFELNGNGADAAASQQRAIEGVEAFIAAVDDNPSLGSPAIVDDAVVTNAVPEFDLEGSRPMVTYVCTLELTRLVPVS